MSDYVEKFGIPAEEAEGREIIAALVEVLKAAAEVTRIRCERETDYLGPTWDELQAAHARLAVAVSRFDVETDAST